MRFKRGGEFVFKRVMDTQMKRRLLKLALAIGKPFKIWADAFERSAEDIRKMDEPLRSYLLWKIFINPDDSL